MNSSKYTASPVLDRQKKSPATVELYEAPRLIQTGSLRNVLGKSHGSTEIVNRFRIAGHKT